MILEVFVTIPLVEAPVLPSEPGLLAAPLTVRTMSLSVAFLKVVVVVTRTIVVAATPPPTITSPVRKPSAPGATS